VTEPTHEPHFGEGEPEQEPHFGEQTEPTDEPAAGGDPDGGTPDEAPGSPS